MGHCLLVFFVSRHFNYFFKDFVYQPNLVVFVNVEFEHRRRNLYRFLDNRGGPFSQRDDQCVVGSTHARR